MRKSDEEWKMKSEIRNRKGKRNRKSETLSFYTSTRNLSMPGTQIFQEIRGNPLGHPFA